MSQNKMLIISGIIVVAIVAILFATANITDSKEVIVIGATIPLTGDLSFIGESGQKAIDLALEEINSKNNKYNFKVIYEDDAFKPSQAVLNAKKLIEVDNVDVIITFGSPTGMAVGSIAEESKVIHIGIATANVGSFGKYNFNHWTPPEAQAKKLVDELSKTNTISIITLNHEGGIAMRDAVVNELSKTNVKMIAEEKFTPGTKDFKTIWQKVTVDNPDTVFFVAQSPEFEKLLEQRIELGIKIPVVTIESPDYTNQPELYNNNWFINASEPSQEFINKFTAKFNDKPRVFSGNAYDIMKILEKVYLETETNASDKIADSLQNLNNYSGIMGLVTVNSDGTLSTDAIIKEIINGESRRI
jgi:branched-chain amino acid transport system substrate-binding protein